jgi:hypothetical protein
MEGPAGWHSEFGRAGFAGTGKRLTEAPEPRNPLEEDQRSSSPSPEGPSPQRSAPKPENRVQQGKATDPWDQPYGDASWGGQAVTNTPEEEKAANESPKTPKGRDRQ